MKIPVCQQQTMPINRQSDADAIYRIFTGGMRATKCNDDAWWVEPILDQQKPAAKGFFSTANLARFFNQYDIKFIAFHNISWSNGVFHSGWSPLILGQTNHMRGPADLWASIASNLAQSRNPNPFSNLENPSIQTISSIVDDLSDEERLAISISISLRNMDKCVEEIAEYYNEQLVNCMSTGFLKGERISNLGIDQNLYAYVLSFFVHTGAVRDYLASLCALRVGMDSEKIDDFARLAGAVRSEHFEKDALLKLFYTEGFFQNKPNSTLKYEPAGWMKEVSDIRKLLVHKRPFGSKFIEKMGYIECINKDDGLYRYTRPIFIDGNGIDVELLILRFYQKMTQLCYNMAIQSGLDSSIMKIMIIEIPQLSM